ncbi:class I SAM-dependent methyltransferase [Rossellomorea sp. SC111]|uniref:class I SAM-dependent methyltransferase n=1 Tax=Rossellomorea sp. SC111 TaxID=2968985 RepID=UPI00215AD7CF|nr:class I SAM-dependent methyltransferase [Rossellomorea sp. SC111]MCR8848834.1 class I SAM-dependent methyltransferase [Rossellomorea sp. SC111]
MEVNFGNLTSRYAASCDDIPHQFFDTLKVRGIVWEGRKVAEIGSGTGAFTRKLHKRGAEVIGVEPSIDLRKTAKALESRQYLEIPYLTGTAESTNLPDHYYDITMSHRSWHLFDRPKAIHEMKRILKDKGTFIVSDSSFLTTQEVVKDTMTFLHEYMGETPEAKADQGNQVNGIPVEWLLEWQQADFTIKDFYTFYYMVDFTIQSWCERVGSLSWLSHLEDTEKEGLLQSLHTFLTRRHDSLHEFTLQHQFTVCLMKK